MTERYTYRKAETRNAGFTFVEILIIATIVVVLLFIFLSGLKHNRKQAASPRTAIVTELKRIETAKALFVTEHHLANGTPLALADLVKAGYYHPSDNFEDITFITGIVGDPVDYKVVNHTDDQ